MVFPTMTHSLEQDQNTVRKRTENVSTLFSRPREWVGVTAAGLEALRRAQRAARIHQFSSIPRPVDVQEQHVHPRR